MASLGPENGGRESLQGRFPLPLSPGQGKPWPGWKVVPSIAIVAPLSPGRSWSWKEKSFPRWSPHFLLAAVSHGWEKRGREVSSRMIHAPFLPAMSGERWKGGNKRAEPNLLDWFSSDGASLVWFRVWFVSCYGPQTKLPFLGLCPSLYWNTCEMGISFSSLSNTGLPNCNVWGDCKYKDKCCC